MKVRARSVIVLCGGAALHPRCDMRFLVASCLNRGVRVQKSDVLVTRNPLTRLRLTRSWCGLVTASPCHHHFRWYCLAGACAGPQAVAAAGLLQFGGWCSSLLACTRLCLPHMPFCAPLRQVGLCVSYKLAKNELCCSMQVAARPGTVARSALLCPR